MKRILALILIGVVAVLCVACSGEGMAKKHDELVTEARSELEAHWQAFYAESEVEKDGYFEIKNTRVITIKDTEVEMFADVAYIVEFDLYTDFFGSAPYYENVGANNNVVIYKDGTMKVSNGLIRMYRGNTYKTDYSDIIESIDDYHGMYNCIKKLK